jgi:hypothetical protein
MATPRFEPPQTNPFGLSDVEIDSSPTFADIDGDGDLDALVGNSAGNTLFFENAPTLSVSAGSNAAEPNTAGSFTLTYANGDRLDVKVIPNYLRIVDLITSIFWLAVETAPTRTMSACAD